MNSLKASEIRKRIVTLKENLKDKKINDFQRKIFLFHLKKYYKMLNKEFDISKVNVK